MHENYLKKKFLEESGFEPEAFRMRSEHSTTELHPHLLLLILKIPIAIKIFLSYFYNEFPMGLFWNTYLM